MIYQERPHIYVHHIGTMTPGQAFYDLPLKLDTEAPFALRGRSIRVAVDDTVSQADVASILTRWRNPRGGYASTDLLPVVPDIGPNGGTGGNPGVVYPNEVYPAGANLLTDVLNNDTALDLDITIYYHGAKLFPPGGIDAPTYPPRCSLLAYSRTRFNLNDPPVTPTISQLAVTQGPPGAQAIFRVGSDGDFAIRSGQAGCNQVNGVQRFSNVFLIIQDVNQKPYMSGGGVAYANGLPAGMVDINHLFGNGNLATFGQFTGPWNPGLFVPELYVKAYGVLYFQFYRDDSAVAGSEPNDIQVVLTGSKVFPR